MSDKIVVYIIAAIILAHFLIGFGWLIYKMNFSEKKKDDKVSFDKDD